MKEIRFLDGVLSEGEFNERIIEHNEFKGKIVFGDGKEGTLYGSSERDIIYSGRGDEILIGGEGVDTYRFSGNFGYDMIRDNGLSGQFNKIEFIDINLQHAHFYKSGDKNSLSIFIRGNNSLEIGTLYNCVTIENYFSDDSNMIESIEFASGEILDKVILKNEFSLLEQSTSDDNPSVSSSKLLNMNMELHGGTIEQVSILNGGTGYDVIIAGISGSEIYGGSGCDKIYSGSGNDNIQGGAGSDDIYFEGRFGHDILKKEDEIYNGFNNGDSIVFEANDSDFCNLR